MTDKLCIELATALILRANTDDPAKADQIRRYLRESFGKAAQRGNWESTDRSNEILAAEALKEVRVAIASERPVDPGPAPLELAVRAAYPLVVSGRLAADRGTANNTQPDRRNPGEVIDAMRRTMAGDELFVDANAVSESPIPGRLFTESSPADHWLLRGMEFLTFASDGALTSAPNGPERSMRS